MSRRNFKGLWSFGGPGYDIRDKQGCAWNYSAYMFMRTQQIFEWTGLPDTIPQRNLELLLQVNGYAAISRADDGNLYAFYGGLGGRPDAYYMPTICTINNPYLNYNVNAEIGKDCEVISNDALYLGLSPLFSRYSQLLAENDVTFMVNDILARMKEFIAAPDDRTKAAADKYLQDLTDGRLTAVGDNAFLDGIQHHSGNGGQRVIDFVEYAQYLRASWFNELGINANYNMKRERLNDGEVNMTNTALLPLVDNMLTCRKIGAEKVNALYGTSIGVEFSGVWDSMKKIAEEDPEDVAGSAEDPMPEAEEGGSEDAAEPVQA